MRLFVAVRPPEDVLDRVEELVRDFRAAKYRASDTSDTGSSGRRGARRGVRWMTREQWHITLRFLGNVDDAAEAVDALEAGLRSMGSVEAAMGPAVERLGSGVLCVPVSGLDELAGAVTAATARIGRPPDARPFHGHLTLGRLPRKGRIDTSPWVGQALGGTWPVEEVQLVRSHTLPQGARYETVHATAVGS